jgi:hypothetical protein
VKVGVLGAGAVGAYVGGRRLAAGVPTLIKLAEKGELPSLSAADLQQKLISG